MKSLIHFQTSIAAPLDIGENKQYQPIHWNENVVILMKFSSLAALEVVILTTFSAASDENFIKMKTFPFQCTLLDMWLPTDVKIWVKPS